MQDGKELQYWNYYSAQWAPVKIEKMNGVKALALKDWDRYEYAKAERVVPSSKKLITEFIIVPQQNDKGQLDIEFADAKGTAAIRLSFDSTGYLRSKSG